MMNFIRYILILTAITPSISVLAANASKDLLRDDFVISGADGLLIKGQDGQWQFEFESDLSDGITTLRAGQPIVILKSATLEKMVEDANQRVEARYRLWGKVTRFEGANYLFASYFAGLRKLEDRRQESAGKMPATQQKMEAGVAVPATAKQAVNSPNDVVKIPDEIVSQLATSEVVPAVETPSAMPLKQDTIFTNRVGHVYERQGKYFFEPDGLGLGVEKGEIELLPCQMLDDAMRQVKSAINPVRFGVAGIITKYKDQRYMLLQKATRVYSYGNFGR